MVNVQEWLEAGLQCPVAEIAFSTAPGAREYCIWFDDKQNITADGVVVFEVHNLTVEFYTRKADSELMATFEKMLTEISAIPDKISEYNDDLRTYITAYRFYIHKKKER